MISDGTLASDPGFVVALVARAPAPRREDALRRRAGGAEPPWASGFPAPPRAPSTAVDTSERFAAADFERSVFAGPSALFPTFEPRRVDGRAFALLARAGPSAAFALTRFFFALARFAAGAPSTDAMLAGVTAAGVGFTPSEGTLEAREAEVAFRPADTRSFVLGGPAEAARLAPARAFAPP